MDGNNKDWCQIMAKFTDHFMVPDLFILLNSCYYRQLWLKIHCIVVINKQILVQIHTSLSYIYLSFGRFYLFGILKAMSIHHNHTMVLYQRINIEPLKLPLLKWSNLFNPPMTASLCTGIKVWANYDSPFC